MSSLVLFAPGACAGRSADAPGSGSERVPEGAWRLVSMDGRAVEPRPMISLELEPERLFGFGGCNAYGARAQVEAGALTVTAIESTAAACLDEALTAREVTYLGRLREATAYRYEGERLVLATAGRRDALAFERIPPSTGDPASLPGTSWRLVSVDGRPPSGTYTMEFVEPGVVVGRAGCRRYRARYAFSGGRLAVPEQSMTGEPCDELAAEEGAYTEALGWAAWYAISEDGLELRTVRGATLVFQPQG